jgi:hypothetical protein
MSIKPTTNIYCAINLQDSKSIYDLEWSANFEGPAAITMPQKLTIKHAVLSIIVPFDSNIMAVPQIQACILSGSNNTSDYTLNSTEKGPETTFKGISAISNLMMVLQNIHKIHTIDTEYLYFDYRMLGELEITISTSTLKGAFWAWNYNRIQNDPTQNPFDSIMWAPTGTNSTPSWKKLKANSFQVSDKRMGNNIEFSLIVERTS